MSQFRRQDDRRRRVLMTTASATAASPTSGSRSRIDSLREARRPTLVYGTRVREGLRGRWFSLVPVDRSAVAKLIAVLTAAVLAIVLMNDATVRFVSIQSRPAFVDVFQIARLGSLGRYAIGVMYLAMAGAAWMIYQLRRFRNDDFRGNYRLWQWIVGVSLVASVATVIPLLAMLGATVELLMGRRLALSGHDWIGLFLVVGGAVLALRTVAETWHYRTSLILLVGGWLCVAIPVAAQWNMIAVDTILRWSIITSAPLLAVMLWFSASVIYLRSLYCEVRGIEPAIGFLQRLRDAAPRGFSLRGSLEPGDTPTAAEPKPARKPANKPAAKPSSPSRVAAKTVTKAKVDVKPEPDEDSDSDNAPAKRRWFGLLPAAKARPAESDSTDASPERTPAPQEKLDDKPAKAAPTQKDRSGEESDEEADTEQAPRERRRWWPTLRGRTKSEAKPDVAEEETQDTPQRAEPDTTEEQPKKRRFGLGSLMKRKANTDSDAAEPEEENKPSSNPRGASGPPPKGGATADEKDDEDDDNDEEGFSDDDIDWSSMNKAERRRMRKQLKRGDRAA